MHAQWIIFDFLVHIHLILVEILEAKILEWIQTRFTRTLPYRLVQIQVEIPQQIVLAMQSTMQTIFGRLKIFKNNTNFYIWNVQID